MKKLLLFLALAISINVISAPPLLKGPGKKIYAADIMIPLGGNTDTKISLLDISVLSIKEAEAIRGEKMKNSEKIAFKVAQNKLRKYINPDGTLNDRKLTKQLKKVGDGGFNAGGFFLGLLLGLIGLIIALLIKDENRQARIKWALIGWGVWIAIVLIAFVV